MNKLLAPSPRKKIGIRERPGTAGQGPPAGGAVEAADDLDRLLPALPSGVESPPLDASARQFPGADHHEIERLYAALGLAGPENNPRTFKLLNSSTRKVSQKVIEEAGEVALEAVKHHASGVVRESADLLYHLVVLWRRAGIEPIEIWEEMRTRADALGIAEKLPKTLAGKKALGRKATVANPN